jgi:hypothetical protein
VAQPVRRSTTWNLLVAPLAAEHRLVIINGPDHGGGPPVRHPFTLDDARAAVDVLDHLGIRSRWTGRRTPGAGKPASCSPPLTRTGASA